MARLVFNHGLAEAAHHALDHALNFQTQIEIIHMLQGKARHPFAEFLGDFPFIRVGMLFHPLAHAPVHARAKLFHEVISERGAALARDMGNPEGGIKADAEKLLQHGGQQNRIAVIQKMIQSAAGPFTDEIFIVQSPAKDLPEHFGADGLLVRFFTKGGVAHGCQSLALWRDVFGQGKLILAFGINGFLPEGGTGFGREIDHRPGKDGVGGTIGRQHEADRLEGFTNDEGDTVLGGFQKEFAVDGRRETGDDDGCHVLQGKPLFPFRRFASQLAVFATKRALRRVYADDVVGHTSVLEIFCATISLDWQHPAQWSLQNF